MVVNSNLEARAKYDELSPDEQKKLHDLIGAGTDKIHAMNLVLSQRAQDAARAGVDADEDLRDKTVGEKASSFAQGLADTLGMGAASTVKGVTAAQGGVVPTIVKGALTGPFSPLVQAVDVARNKDAFDKAKAEQDTAQKSADEQAPAAAGAGHLAGDVVNSALAAAGPLKSAAQAAEDIAAGAKPSTVLPNPAAAAKAGAAAVGNAAKAVASRLENLSPAARAALAVTTAGKSEAAGAVARMLAKLAPEEIAPGIGEATASPVPDVALDRGELADMLKRLKSPPATPAAKAAPAAADLEAAAEGFDPRGEDWKAFATGKAPPAPARPDLDAAAKQLSTGTKVDRTPTPASLRSMAQDVVATPLPDETDAELRAIAAQKLAGEAPTRELNLPELRDQEALALREGRPTAVTKALGDFTPSHAGDPNVADLRANGDVGDSWLYADDPELRAAARALLEGEIAKAPR